MGDRRAQVWMGCGHRVGGQPSLQGRGRAGLAMPCGSHPLAGQKHLPLVRRHQALEVETQCLGVSRGTNGMVAFVFSEPKLWRKEQAQISC